MTSDARPQAGPGSLRTRLLIAFVAVTAAAIALVSGAALVGADRSLTAQAASERQSVAGRAADAVARAYVARGGWEGADLGPAVAAASGAGARLVVRTTDGDVVFATGGAGQGQGPGMGMGPGGGMGLGHQGGSLVSAAVQVDGSTVATVNLVYPAAASSSARPVAWAWVGVAAAVALALALGAAYWITRTLTRPLAVLTATARSFAHGDRGARAHLPNRGELGELAAAFDEAAEQVQHSERARRQLSADVAHELRTPLAALQAGLEELRDGLVPADAETFARLHDQTLRLGRVVADLAQLSAADAARLTLRREPLDLAAVVGEAADEYEARLRAAGLTLTRALTPVEVEGDTLRLHQVIGNLLQNCARHCRPGDSVTVTVGPDEDGALARLAVRDTGPGISAEDLPHVFTRFWRSGRSLGSGLGMAIVRSLVEAHDGSVTAESDGRSGTLVTVRLPASTPVRAGGSHFRESPPSSRIA